jgi:hypothetical protein
VSISPAATASTQLLHRQHAWHGVTSRNESERPRQAWSARPPPAASDGRLADDGLFRGGDFRLGGARSAITDRRPLEAPGLAGKPADRKRNGKKRSADW